MSDKKRNEAYDEIIKMSIKMSKESETKAITDEDVINMGYDLPPADMYDRIMKAAEQNPPRKKAVPMKKLLVIAAIIIGVLIIGIGAYGVKVYVYNIEGSVTENAIKFRGTNENEYAYEADESEAYKSAEEALGTAILKPTYMPEGFTFDSIRIYPKDYIVLVYKKENKMIKIKQELLREQVMSERIGDEKYGNIYTFDFGKQKVSVGEQTQVETNVKWLKAVWKDEKLTYMADTNCSKKELEKFIKNLK